MSGSVPGNFPVGSWEVREIERVVVLILKCISFESNGIVHIFQGNFYSNSIVITFKIGWIYNVKSLPL